MTNNNPYLFWPQGIGPYEEDLRNLITLLAKAASHSERISIIEKSLRNLPVYPNTDGSRLRYRSYIFVLLDLMRQHWQPEYRQGQLYLRPPAWTQQPLGDQDIENHKKVIRHSLSWERKAQFHKESIREFIRYMERQRLFNGQMISIRSLLADGRVLAQDLKAIANVDNQVEQNKKVRSVIQPYLQLIGEDERCPHTGLRLLDIWRYLRYTWATPYNPTPGRQMFYLVRDGKRRFHPIIGIAALGSSMVQLAVRDNVIGWTPEAFHNRLYTDDFDDIEAQKINRMLRKTLVDVLDDIDTDNLVTDKEISFPTQAVIERLERIETESRALRIQLLQQRKEQDEWPDITPNQLPLNLSDESNLSDLVATDKLTQQANQALFRAKRANVLHRLLQAKRVLDTTKYTLETQEGLKAFWTTIDGQKVIKTLIRENKKRKVGINMMDIIVCGAVPPYNIILGGKLTAMLLVSPRVVKDYRQKYEGYVSNIASKMKGTDVKRDPELVFLGTTSLYVRGSSQYNRISIPVPLRDDEQIRFIKYGLTKGYGSVHFSEETRESLNELQEYSQKARLINNSFGEGVNPKLRRVSAGLASIGITAVDRFIKHRSQRIVYGVPLGRAAYAYLRRETNDPEYFFDADSSKKIKEWTSYISQFWAERWLLKRIKKPVFLNKVMAFRIEDFLLSTELSVHSESEERIQQSRMDM